MMRFRSILIVAALAVIGSLMPAAAASAVSYRTGYFFAPQFPDDRDGANVISSCVSTSTIALPADSLDVNLVATPGNPVDLTVDKASFISLILGYYNGGSGCGTTHSGSTYTVAGNKTRNSIGSQFIIQSMLGAGYKDAANLTHYQLTELSAADESAAISDWQARINSPNIGVRWVRDYVVEWVSGGVVYAKRNTAYDGNWDDVEADDYYHYNQKNSTVDLIEFYNISTGEVYYQIKYDCANPIGDLPGIPFSPSWDLSIESKVGVGDHSWHFSPEVPAVTPGTAVHWYHTVQNDGPDIADSLIKYGIENNTNLENATSLHISTAEKGQIATSPGLAVGLANAKGFNSPEDITSFKVTQDEVGVGNLCQRAYATPGGSSGGTEYSAHWSCVVVPYNYNLIPTITVDPSGGVVAGQTMTPHPKVQNDGPTKSPLVNWSVNVYRNGVYHTTSKSSFTSSFPLGSTDLAGGTFVIDGGIFNPGDRACFTLTINPSSSSGGSLESSPSCVTIGKKPKVQVWGGDLWSTGGVQTSTSTVSGLNYGSWSEYAILSAQAVKGMASGSFFAMPGSPTECQFSILTFKNEGCAAPGNVGFYASSRNVPDVAASFPILGSTPSTSDENIISSSASGTYTISAATFTIHGNNATTPTIAVGRWLVINAPNTDITIDGDITYSNGPVTAIGDIPQLIIIAKNIYITENVKNIDSWLIARGGTINTCSGYVFENIRTTNCIDKLVVNGPVIAKTLLLYRTAGSELGDFGAPAEVFNLRADAYLWAASQATSSRRVQTVYTIEQPPRF